MAEGGFRLPGSAYGELVNIIIAYGTRDEASNPGDVSKLDSVHRSSVTRTNGFLVEIGVLRGEREKLVTKRGRELALALDRRDRVEIRTSWRQIVSTSEFLQNVVSAVKLREGMAYTSVQAYIAHAAGQPRNKPVMIGASTVVEILKTAELLVEDSAGELTATHAEEESAAAGEPPITIGEVGIKDEDFLQETPDLSLSTASEEEQIPVPDPTLNIHLHVRCDADDLEDVAPRLRNLLRDLKEDFPHRATLRTKVEKIDEVEKTPEKPATEPEEFERDFLEENANPPIFDGDFDDDFGAERGRERGF